nr:putative reverse transcriptase, RNA-dependent DNA polymerase, Gag-polypeptide of LTR copia-type [Tanacetum cinerariifolium]
MTTIICLKSKGRIGFARVLVELNAEKEVKNKIEIIYKGKDISEGMKKVVDVEYAWKPLVCTHCKVFGHDLQRRQYDSLVNLPDCICKNSEKLKKRNQLLKLMQFLIGLDEIYAPIRSIILTTDLILDVKGAFVILSIDESHRIGYPPNFNKTNGSNQGGSSNATIPVTKDQSYISSNTFKDEQYKRLMALISEKSRSGSIPANVSGHPNDTKAVVTHNGSPRLTDKITINDVLVVQDYQDSVLRTQVRTGSESNGLYFLNTVLNNSDNFSSRSENPMFVGYSFDKKGYKLYSLESKKIFYSRDVKFYETVFPFKHSSEWKEYEMHYQKTNSLNFFDLEDNCVSDDPYNDGRDKESEISKVIDPIISPYL